MSLFEKQYVPHPRYGDQPRYHNFIFFKRLRENLINFHMRSRSHIPGTGIKADESKQVCATFPATYYFDEEKTCVDCNREFLFYAEEQKYWYEELGFPSYSDCVRCFPCRKRYRDKRNKINSNHERYQALYHIDRNVEQHLEMADCCLTLIEEQFYTRRKIQFVRMLLNKVRSTEDEQIILQIQHLEKRVVQLEATQ